MSATLQRNIKNDTLATVKQVSNYSCLSKVSLAYHSWGHNICNKITSDCVKKVCSNTGEPCDNIDH